jgi:hypothetical protein
MERTAGARARGARIAGLGIALAGGALGLGRLAATATDDHASRSQRPPDVAALSDAIDDLSHRPGMDQEVLDWLSETVTLDVRTSASTGARPRLGPAEDVPEVSALRPRQRAEAARLLRRAVERSVVVTGAWAEVEPRFDRAPDRAARARIVETFVLAHETDLRLAKDAFDAAEAYLLDHDR